MRLQSLLFPQRGVCETEELYFHRGTEEEGRETLDLDGYFNLFYLEKHRKFTALDGVEIRAVLCGYSCAVLMHDREELESVMLSPGEGTYRFSFPYDRFETGVFWLRLVTDGETPEAERKAEGYFAGISGRPAGEDDTWNGLRDIRIAVVICTFRREPYVLRNLRSLVAFFERFPLLAEHFQVFLIDNGRTLSGREDFQELLPEAKGRIRLIENRNNGGTGGFTRGMEEAIRRRAELGLTNLLLLDDDAVFDPDLFLRLYGLLATLREEYRDITIGGAMWREEMPYIQHASGERHERFRVTNPMLMLDLREFSNCVRRDMTSADEKSGLYSGWWCCCYSMEIIRRENLPLPLFIHRDDILFCRMHADQGILFLNGIGVWHQSFELRFPGVNEYYNTRNELITAAILDRMRPAEAARWAIRQLSGPLLSFRYAEMHLAYRGMRDFLKGPDWLDGVDGEALHGEIGAYYRERVEWKPLRELLGERRYPEFAKAYLSEKARAEASLAFWTKRGAHGSLWKYLTLNGWLLPAKRRIAYYCNADSPWRLYRYRRALLYEPEADRGYLSRRDGREMASCAWMALRVSAELLLRYRALEREYRKRAGLRR